MQTIALIGTREAVTKEFGGCSEMPVESNGVRYVWANPWNYFDVLRGYELTDICCCGEIPEYVVSLAQTRVRVNPWK